MSFSDRTRGTLLTRSVLACLLVGLGTLLLVTAILIPTYAYSRLAKTPLDLQVTTVATSQSNAASEVLDSKSLAAQGPLVVDSNVPLVSQRFLTVEEPSDATEMTTQAGQTVRRVGGVQGDTGLLSATVDLVTIDRRTGMPVDKVPNGSIATDIDRKGNSVPEAVQHTGLQYRFPIGTQRQNYPYFDSTARKSFDIQYVEQAEVNALQVYHFRQQLPVVDLSTVGKSPSNRLTLPAQKWGVDGDGSVTMNRYYTVVRDLWVEPKTGTIVKGGEAVNLFYARQPDRPEVTTMKSTLVFDDSTVSSQIALAKKSMDKLSLLGRTLPLVLGLVGALTLLTGLVLGLRSAGRHARQWPPRDSVPATDYYSDAPTQQLDLDALRRPGRPR